MTVNKPTVSVIIPTYNRAHLISRAMQSVLDQTYGDFELIVVDDGSTDNTEEVVRSFNDTRIRFVRHEHNSGVSVARNTGIRTARGEYIDFLDDDDELLPSKLEHQLQLFQESKMEKLGLVLCGMTIVRLVNTHDWLPTQRGWTYEYFLAKISGSYSGLPGWLVKRSLAIKVGPFDEKMENAEDIDWLIRASRLSQIDYVPEYLVIVHQERQYDVHTSILSGRLSLMEKYSEELALRPRVLQNCHKSVALRYHWKGNRQEVRRHMLLAVKAYPLNFQPYIWLLASLFGHWPFSAALKLFPDAKNTL